MAILIPLREAREKAGITQVALAKQTGLSQAHISYLERFPSRPSYRTVERLAYVLKVKPSMLHFGPAL